MLNFDWSRSIAALDDLESAVGGLEAAAESLGRGAENEANSALDARTRVGTAVQTLTEQVERARLQSSQIWQAVAGRLPPALRRMRRRDFALHRLRRSVGRWLGPLRRAGGR